MADLRFAGAEFTEDFGDGAGFNAAGEEGIELFRASGDGYQFGAPLVHFCGGSETHRDQFGSWVGYQCPQT